MADPSLQVPTPAVTIFGWAWGSGLRTCPGFRAPGAKAAGGPRADARVTDLEARRSFRRASSQKPEPRATTLLSGGQLEATVLKLTTVILLLRRVALTDPALMSVFNAHRNHSMRRTEGRRHPRPHVFNDHCLIC